MQDDRSPNADEFVWGSEAIGRESGLTERQARYLLATGKLPAKQLGRVYVSSKRALREAVTPAVGD